MRKALVVGINNYPFAPLSGCISDANEIARLLRRNGDGSPNFDVRLLTDADAPITRAKLREAIQTLFQGDAEVSLLYFSGHGMITPVGGSIVTPDARKYDEGISMDEILTLANKSSARDRIIILDCCHSGAMGSPAVMDGEKSALTSGLTVLTASRDNESALEENGHGVFTSLLIDALEGGASDLRGHITPGSLYAYVDEALGAWDQRPVFKTNISRSVVVRKVNPPIPLEVLRNITTYFPTPTSEHKLSPAYEFTSGEADPEKVKVFKDLQKLESVGLVKPVGEEHMYFAAMNSKSCALTAFGRQYWRLVSEGKV